MSERLVRRCRGLASLALLVGLVAGVPAALVVLGGDPLPETADVRALWGLLLRPDDGTVLARLLALVGWVAWVVFTLSLLVELVNLLGHRQRALVLPGLGGVQQWAAGLMLTVVAIGGAAQLAPGPTAPQAASARTVPETDRAAAGARSAVSRPVPADRDTTGPDARASTPPSPRAESPSRPATPAPAAAPVPLTAPHGQRERVHVVEAGDDLWSLAEQYYGRGQEWRRIAAANPDLLTGGPDRLRVGWRLLVPEAEDAAGAGSSPAAPGVRVRVGDTLSSVAARVLGDADRWRELYRANRDQLSDPDELPAGLVLRVPGAPDDSAASDAPAARERGAEVGDEAPEDAGPGPVTPSSDRTEPGPAASPTAAAPEPAPVPSSTAPATTTAPHGGAAAPTPAEAEPAGTDETETGSAVVLPGLATVGGLLAASLVGGLAARRRWQLQQRPVGRRVAHPPPDTRPVEVALARRARPIGLRTLDRASRAVAAAAVGAGVGVPALRGATVSAEWLVLELAGPTPPAPRCFVDTGGTWCLAADAADGLRDVPGLGDASRPWPLLVTLGTEPDGAERVVDLESLGVLAVTGDEERATAVMAAMALELACSPWTDDLRLTLVGDGPLADALAQHNVQGETDLDAVVDRLERLAAVRVAHSGGAPARDLRLDRDRSEAWTPEVVLVDVRVAPVQADRLARLLTPGRDTGITVVLRGSADLARTTLALGDDGLATLLPDGVRLVPQALAAEGLDPVVALVGATGSEETDPAPWWSGEGPADDPPDNVTYLGRRRRTDDGDEQERRAAVQARMTEAADGTVRHPLLLLLGPVELLGAAGTPPTRAARQCLEYCAWLLEHPGTTAQSMAAGLLVAEGTRRSNMSRLRTWLGSGTDGEPYLPDAYSGRISLDPVVSSDWHQLRLLLADGVDRAPTSLLELGLRLVRGAPLADAAPVQWHWAEALRTDMISCVRDLGVELTRRALEERDLDLARWAAARALLAAPGDEVLLAGRIRTEHLAGNAAETERLSLQLAQQARALGADLHPATVDLLQEVMEGRLRARLA